MTIAITLFFNVLFFSVGLIVGLIVRGPASPKAAAKAGFSGNVGFYDHDGFATHAAFRDGLLISVSLDRRPRP